VVWAGCDRSIWGPEKSRHKVLIRHRLCQKFEAFGPGKEVAMAEFIKFTVLICLVLRLVRGVCSSLAPARSVRGLVVPEV
jgi:hypothetical protein